MYERQIEPKINTFLEKPPNKILFIWGPRRSGKTTILKKISQKYNVNIFNFDTLTDREYFEPRREVLERLVRSIPLILIDEVQNYPQSTVALKILHDEFNAKIIATGSSELRKKDKEFDTLAGRFEEVFCMPLSIKETIDHHAPKPYELPSKIIQIAQEQQLFGSYPEISLIEDEQETIQQLKRLIDTYVLKDIIDIYNLKDLKLARDILIKLALQIGNEVSIREIASSLQSTAVTVSNYIEIFIKNYILILLPSFKTNLRRAVSTNKKIYFTDLGIRNALIDDFRKPELRQDKGALFENYVISEIEKRRLNEHLLFNKYFYREYGGRETDIVLENYKKEYSCFEVKTGNKKLHDIFPLTHTFDGISPTNFYDLIYKYKP